MKMVRCVTAAAAALCLAGAAEATVSISFTGKTTSSDIAGTADTFSGTLSYETNSLPNYTVDSPTSRFSDYGSITGHLTFTSGSISFDADDWIIDQFGVGVSDGNGEQDSAVIGVPTLGPILDFITAVDLTFWDQAGTTLTTADLPNEAQLAAFLPTSAADNARGSLFYFESNDPASMNPFVGAITSLQAVSTADEAAAVPEPASWAMMVAGFGLIGAAMRRRRTRIAFA